MKKRGLSPLCCPTIFRRDTKSMGSLRTKAIRSLSWSAGAKLASQGVTFFATILLARLLGASEFGLVALSLVYTGFIQMFIDAGFLQAIIQRPSIEQRELSSCFWLLLIAGCIAFSASLLVTDLLDRFFKAQGIGLIIVAQSSIFLFLPFRTIAQALLSRDVRIDLLSKLEVLLNIMRFGFSILMAWKGAGVWSLVIPMVLCEIIYSLCCYHLTGWRLSAEFSWQALKPIAAFGVNISLSRVVWYAASRVDQFIIGKVLGTESLGVYSLAMQFANVIPQFASSTLSRVVFPVFSRLQIDRPRLKESFLGVTRYTTLIFLPAFLGIGLVAPDLFFVTFKPAWYQSIIPLQFLCILAFFRLCEAISGFLVNARGKSQFNLVMNLVSLVFTSVGSYVGAHIWGINGVALLATISFIPVALLTASVAVRESGGCLLDYLMIFQQPVVATLVMLVGVFAFGRLIDGAWHITRIAGMTLSGITIYVFVMLLLSPGILKEIKNELPSYQSN